LQTLYETLIKILKEGYWRTRRPSDWNIVSKVAEKSLTGYVGIENPGCICYMTSFFQQMYMIPSLRQAIFESEDP
jgi:ubiquitin C-terminal hydrolase